MAATKPTMPLDRSVNPQDPSTWLKPDEPLIGADGRDWSWAYVWFKDVPWKPGYKVEWHGTAWSSWVPGRRRLKSGRWRRLKTPIGKRHGYRIVCLGGEFRSRFSVLMLRVFVGPRPPENEACHNNGVRHDDRLSNLRWDTRPGNKRDEVLHGTATRGERNGSAKLAADDVLEIRRRVAAGETQRSMALLFGVGNPTIHKIVHGDRWRHLQ